MTMAQMRENSRARVVRVGITQKKLKKRLLDMGLVPGTELTLCGRAPMGDPLEIELRGYKLTIRVAEAEHIQVRYI